MNPTHPIDSTNSTMMSLEELSQLASQLQENIATVQNMVMTTRKEIESLSQQQTIQDRKNKMMDARLATINQKAATIDQQLAEIQGRKPRQVRNLSPEVRQEIEKAQERAEMETVSKIVWISVAMFAAVSLVVGIIVISAGAPIWLFAVYMAALMLGGLAFDPLFREQLKQPLYDCFASCELSTKLEDFC